MFRKSYPSAKAAVLAALAMTSVTSSTYAAIVCGPQANVPIPGNLDGVYINLVTGATGTAGSGVAGWDFNGYQTGTPASLFFFWPSAPATSFGGVATGNVYNVLAANAPIGPAQTFSVASGGGGSANYVDWLAANGDNFLGVRFFNETAAIINFGWMKLNTTAPSGFPATIVQYCYQTDGTQILAGDTGVVTPQANLSITKDDGVTVAAPGTSVTYTITASNPGPSAATGATVSDTPPAQCDTFTWTCIGAAGGTCAASGTGAIADTVNLPVAGTVTYTAICAINVAAVGSLSNTATVAAPAGVTDPTPANNSATDVDQFPFIFGDGFEDVVLIASSQGPIPFAKIADLLSRSPVVVGEQNAADGASERVYARKVNGRVEYVIANKDARGHWHLGAWQPAPTEFDSSVISSKQ